MSYFKYVSADGLEAAAIIFHMWQQTAGKGGLKQLPAVNANNIQIRSPAFLCFLRRWSLYSWCLTAQLRRGLQNQPDVAMSDQALIVLATESDI